MTATVTAAAVAEFDTAWRLSEQARLGDVLARLGRTGPAVAAVLRTAGIVGAANVAGSCPLANYLRSAGYEQPSVSWGKTAVRVCGVTVEVANPRAVYTFLAQFDNGRHRSLLRHRGA